MEGLGVSMGGKSRNRRIRIILSLGDIAQLFGVVFAVVGISNYFEHTLDAHKKMASYRQQGLDVGIGRVSIQLNVAEGEKGYFGFRTLHEGLTLDWIKNDTELKMLRSAALCTIGAEEEQRTMSERVMDWIEEKTSVDIDGDGVLGDARDHLTEGQRKEIYPYLHLEDSDAARMLKRKIINLLSMMHSDNAIEADALLSHRTVTYVWGVAYESNDVSIADRKLRVILIREDLLRAIHECPNLARIPSLPIFKATRAFRLRDLKTLGRLHFSRHKHAEKEFTSQVLHGILFVSCSSRGDEEKTNRKRPWDSWKESYFERRYGTTKNNDEGGGK